MRPNYILEQKTIIEGKGKPNIVNGTGDKGENPADPTAISTLKVKRLCDNLEASVKALERIMEKYFELKNSSTSLNNDSTKESQSIETHKSSCALAAHKVTSQTKIPISSGEKPVEKTKDLTMQVIDLTAKEDVTACKKPRKALISSE